MAWEIRGGRRYYYRKVRKGGQVFSVYEGGGFSGQLTAERAAQERAEAQRQRRSFKAELTAQDRIDEQIEQSWRLAKAAADAALEAAGYHRHKRQWRLKREQNRKSG